MIALRPLGLMSCACVTHDPARFTPAWSPVTLGEVSVQGNGVLTVTGPWSSEDSESLRRSGSTALWLNYAHGFSEPTLRLVEDLPATITRLHITARWITDLSPVAVLGDRLEALVVSTAPTASLDLTQLPVLTELATDWGQVQAAIGAAVRLVAVYLSHYGDADLTKLAPLQLLERLTLKDRPSIASLTGSEHLTSLKHLTVVLARNLSDLTALDSAVGRQLETLDLESCRRIDDLGAIGRCICERLRLQVLLLSHPAHLSPHVFGRVPLLLTHSPHPWPSTSPPNSERKPSTSS